MSGEPAATAERSADVLRERAERFWRARLEEDWETAWEFEDLRAVPDATKAQFVEWSRENEPFRVHEYEILRADADGSFGWVEVETSLSARRFPGAPVRTVQRWDNWQLVDGRWLPINARAKEQFPVARVLRDLAAEPALRARCQEFWEARRDEDWDRIVELCEPDDREQVGPLMLSESQGMLKYVSHEIFWVEATGDTGRSRVRFVHRLDDPSMTKAPPMALNMIENWVKVDGQWYVDLVADVPVDDAATARQQETNP
ncbi:MAG: hypothetical protein ACYTJ0_05385 [Planctomycetota bacterium]|jgi:hypothetical protein